MPAVLSRSLKVCVLRDSPSDTLRQKRRFATRLLILEGLPEGTKPANVLRCVELVDHAVTCRATPSETCSEGEGCRRTKQVLHHYFTCESYKNVRGGGKEECSICRQVLALCRNHSIFCQASEGSCVVPHCRNNKQLQRHLRPNEIQPGISSVEGTKEEYQYVIQNLREAVSLPSKEDKAQSLRRLLRTNHHMTIKLIKHILYNKYREKLVGMISKKNSGKPAGIVQPRGGVEQLCNQMSFLDIAN